MIYPCSMFNDKLWKCRNQYVSHKLTSLITCMHPLQFSIIILYVYYRLFINISFINMFSLP